MSVDDQCQLLLGVDADDATALARSGQDPTPQQQTLTTALRAGWDAATHAADKASKSAPPSDPFEGIATTEGQT